MGELGRAGVGLEEEDKVRRYCSCRNHSLSCFCGGAVIFSLCARLRLRSLEVGITVVTTRMLD